MSLKELDAAREEFLALVETIRPDLHRYVSRLVGSAIDGEDLVQDSLAKAFYALSQMPEPPPGSALRPWLFTIARNAALDFLRRFDRRFGGPLDEEHPMSDDEPRDPFALRVALSAFAALPVAQRSAVILKDVLGESHDTIAAHLDTTVGAVKSLLVRGRAALASVPQAAPVAVPPETMALVERYAALFDARDWSGVQALLVDEVRLDLVAKTQRRGKSVGGYFGQYAKLPDLRFRAGVFDARPAVLVSRGEALLYVILLEWNAEGRVTLIRDFRYVPYLVPS